MLIWLRRHLLNILAPFLKWASGKHMPFTHKEVTGKNYREAVKLLKPGHIFVSKIDGELTSYIIPGTWTHAALYVGDEKVIEAEGEGVIVTDLINFMVTKDALLILEPVGPDQFVRARACVLAIQQLGKPYDYDLDFHISDQKAFYCSELVWWSYAEACKELSVPCPFRPRKTLGVDTVSPNDIAHDPQCFQIVYDSRSRT